MRTDPQAQARRDAVELDLVVQIGEEELADVEVDLDAELEAEASWNRFLYFVAAVVALGIVALVLVVSLGGADPPQVVRENGACTVVTDAWVEPDC